MANLLHHPLCAFSRSIRLALAECGVEVELNEEKPWEWRPEFLALNPAGTLPVLLSDDEGPIAGSYAISEWLSDTLDLRPIQGFQPFPGDLAFTAFCDTDLVGAVDTAFARLPGSRWLYWNMLVGHIVLFTVALAQISRGLIF